MTRRLRAPSTESLFVGVFVVLGLRAGAHSITDNSMLTHLRTGIDMVAGGGIPRRDPYSYTAAGHEWVVQSWFPSWTYGVLEKVGTLHLVVFQQAALTAALAWLCLRLARAGTPMRTALAGACSIGIGVTYWSQRPLLFGLVCFALLVTVVERRHHPAWLLPIMWVWVNSHGSFPLGLAWLGARLVGEWLDTRRTDLRYLWAFLGGLVLAVVNPLGPKLLAFAVTVGEKRRIFRYITEWQSPDFQSGQGLLTLAVLVLALVVLFQQRVAWSDLLPVAGFLGLALVAVRNMPVLAIVVAPALGHALRPTAAAPVRRGAATINVAFAAVLAFGALIVGLSARADFAVDVSGYPVAATRFLEREGLLDEPHRLANQDDVGNYLIFRRGRNARVFVDDRYDMYPVDIGDDYKTLLDGGPAVHEVLARHRVDTVLWNRELPLVTTLRATDEWEQVFRRKDWVVLVKRS